MERLARKIAKGQDCNYQTENKVSHETSICISADIYQILGGRPIDVSLRIYKEDFIKALSVLVVKMPLYITGTVSKKVSFSNDWYTLNYSTILQKFGDNEYADLELKITDRTKSKSSNTAKYLYPTKTDKFPLRAFLIAFHSVLTFTDKGNRIDLRLESYIEEQSDNEINNTIIDNFDISSIPNHCIQMIIYGAPGTGKSHSIMSKFECETGDSIHSECFRTTFHPDTDYSSFVGCYKPIKEYDSYGQSKISYEFVSQTFLDAYVYAWQNLDKKCTLIIEEINRGNCAQIFGDLFQLLDRDDDGFSKYSITVDKDIQYYLYTSLGEYYRLIINARYKKDDESCSRMALPPNMAIIATMNTSDQSLFPIDSAFKRRWNWKYVPISEGVDSKTKEELKWKIKIDDDFIQDWWEFIQYINKEIEDKTHSEDKKLGYFFCKADSNKNIDADKFVSKVVFYLWNDVFKDYGFNSKLFKSDDGKTKLSFHQFYNGDGSANIQVVKSFINRVMGKRDIQQPKEEPQE